MTRVAITTSRDHAAGVAGEFDARGLEPVILPCIEVMPGDPDTIERLRSAAGGADWLLVTSARSIHRIWPDGAMPGVSVAAVGGGTARAVASAGGRVQAEGRAGAAGLVEQLGSLDGRTVVYPHASKADRLVMDRLRAAGAVVVSGAAYRVQPIRPENDPVDAVAFGSPSAVEGWCSARALDGLLVGAIGHTTANALERRGFPAHAVPDRPGFGRLAAIMARHSRERSAR